MSEENAAKAQIHNKIFICGQIIAETGLHIGGNSVGLAIGGVDNVVVRNPLNNQPYIPGSSLRGKMRSLLERLYGLESSDSKFGGFSFEEKETKDGKTKYTAGPGKNPNTLLGMLFGIAADSKGELPSPTRLIVRDAPLSDESVAALKNAPNLDMPLTEVKTEVVIDRITSAANPRQFERVPAGVIFNFCFVLTLLEEDVKEKRENELVNLVFKGLELLQEDALGGHGSRGYGQVKFKIPPLKCKTRQDYIDNVQKMSDYNFTIPDIFKPCISGVDTPKVVL